MNLSQIKQALNIRTLRADKAERALATARATEAKAMAMLASAESQIRAFDASYEERVAAFFEKAAMGVTPDSLNSSRSFHSDLAKERAGLETFIQKARDAVAVTSRDAAKARTVWIAASQASKNLEDIYKKKRKEQMIAQERSAERDADELSIARAFRDAG